MVTKRDKTSLPLSQERGNSTYQRSPDSARNGELTIFCRARAPLGSSWGRAWRSGRARSLPFLCGSGGTAAAACALGAYHAGLAVQAGAKAAAALACKRETRPGRLRCGVTAGRRRQHRLRHFGAPIMKSTIGRPRRLTDRQVKIILAWHFRFLIWRALRKTLKSQRDLARELGVSQATISYVIRLGGRYKQVSPERRTAEIRQRSEKLARLRRKGLL
jgi:hypothetical protein